jgi:hypothetical protein
METKVVYFVIDGREEQAEFRSDDEGEDVRGKEVASLFLFRVCVF